MAHQAHNIPWITLASHLKFIRDARHVTPHRTDLFPLEKPNQANDLNYFTKRLHATIMDFAQTERLKYPAKYDAKDEGQLFSEELIERTKPYVIHPWPDGGYSLTDLQRLEQWFNLVKPGYQGKPYFHAENEDLAEAVSVLIEENEIPAILKLAQHPKLPPLKYLNGGNNYHYGVSLLARDALRSYILFNVLFCKPELWEGGREDYKEMDCYKNTIEDSVRGHGGEAAKYPHREFLGSPFSPAPYDPPQPDVLRFDLRGNYMTDLDRLKTYLKKCFELLARYEVVRRECGIEFDWEEEIENVLAARYWTHSLFSFKMKRTEDESGWCFA
jgi:hypothetical protein